MKSLWILFLLTYDLNLLPTLNTLIFIHSFSCIKGLLLHGEFQQGWKRWDFSSASRINPLKKAIAITWQKISAQTEIWIWNFSQWWNLPCYQAQSKFLLCVITLCMYVITLCMYLLYLLISIFLPWPVWPIMKYMGDYPSKRFRQTTDLTDAIFEPALLHVSDNHDSN